MVHPYRCERWRTLGQPYEIKLRVPRKEREDPTPPPKKKKQKKKQKKKVQNTTRAIIPVLSN